MGEKHGENIKLHVHFSGIRKKERLEIKTHVEQNLHLVMKIKIYKTVWLHYKQQNGGNYFLVNLIVFCLHRFNIIKMG